MFGRRGRPPIFLLGEGFRFVFIVLGVRSDLLQNPNLARTQHRVDASLQNSEVKCYQENRNFCDDDAQRIGDGEKREEDNGSDLSELKDPLVVCVASNFQNNKCS